MRMNDVLFWAALVGAGFFSGVASFSGLWFSVRRTLMRVSHPGWLATGSLARLALIAGVFWISTRGDAVKLAAVLAGFLIAQAAALGFGARCPWLFRGRGGKSP